MNDRFALAAVMHAIAEHLRTRLQDQIPGVNPGVKLLTPDKLADPDTDHLNLFLYELRPSAAFRNSPLPGAVRDGESAPPPLALELFFLLSAHTREDESGLRALRLMGAAMAVLHDLPLLDGIRIDTGEGDETYRYPHAERVRITPHTLNFEELTKLWGSFKAPIVPAAAYRVSPVLMESALPPRVPPPVLRRGEEDRGVDARGNLDPPFPVVEALGLAAPERPPRRPRGLPVFELDERVVIRGHRLAEPGGQTRVFVTREGEDFGLPVEGAATPTAVTVPLDGAVLRLAGHYRLFVEVTPAGGAPRQTAEVPLMIAPVVRFVSEETLVFPPPDAAGRRAPQELVVAGDADFGAGQSVTLLIAHRQVPREPPAPGDPPNEVAFRVPAVEPGTYPIRLRVDGVDSLPIVEGGVLKIGKEVTVRHD